MHEIIILILLKATSYNFWHELWQKWPNFNAPNGSTKTFAPQIYYNPFITKLHSEFWKFSLMSKLTDMDVKVTAATQTIPHGVACAIFFIVGQLYFSVIFFILWIPSASCFNHHALITSCFWVCQPIFTKTERKAAAARPLTGHN